MKNHLRFYGDSILLVLLICTIIIFSSAIFAFKANENKTSTQISAVKSSVQSPKSTSAETANRQASAAVSRHGLLDEQIKLTGAVKSNEENRLSDVATNSNKVESRDNQTVQNSISTAKPQLSNKMSKKEFVSTVYYYAKISETKTGVPAAIATAQAILESGFGRYVPVDINTKQYSYNLFGMKGRGPAGSVACSTYEYEGGGQVKRVIKFQAYNSFEESINAHGELLSNNKIYAKLQTSKDPKEWARGLQKAGYATSPTYAQELIATMNAWGLE